MAQQVDRMAHRLVHTPADLHGHVRADAATRGVCTMREDVMS